MGKQSFIHTPQLPGWQRISLTNLESAVSQCNWVSAGEPWTTKLATKALELVQDEQKTNQQKVPRSKWSVRVFFKIIAHSQPLDLTRLQRSVIKGERCKVAPTVRLSSFPSTGEKHVEVFTKREIYSLLQVCVCVCVRVCCSPTHSCGYTEDGSYIGMK